MKVRTYRDAVRFVNEAGLAFVFPDNRTPLPSLWGAVCGDPTREMDEEDWGWTRAVAKTWELKDELGARRGAWFGRLVRGKGTLVALDLLAPMAALVRDDYPSTVLGAGGLSALAREAHERLGNVGALSTLRLRESLRLHGSKGNAAFGKIMLELYRRLLVANVGVDDSETHWPAAVVDRFERAYPRVAREAATLARDEAIARVRRRLPEAEPRFLAMITGIPSAAWKEACPEGGRSSRRRATAPAARPPASRRPAAR